MRPNFNRMYEVEHGCKVCGKRMLTDYAPGRARTCAECKAKQKREVNRRMAAKRKAKRHAIKEKMGMPVCQHCSKAIKGARLTADGQWARKFCGNTCRQAAFRAINRCISPKRP